MRFFCDALPPRAKYFICTFIALGFPVLIYCLYRTIFFADASWLLLASVTALASYFPVRLPYFKGRAQALLITTSDIFIFTAILFFSPEVAAAISVVDVVLGVKTKKFYKIIFNLSEAPLVTFLVGHLFYQLLALEPPLQGGSGQFQSRTGLLASR